MGDESPPPEHNFIALPPIRSERPVFGRAPSRADVRCRRHDDRVAAVLEFGGALRSRFRRRTGCCRARPAGTCLARFMAFGLSFVAGYMIVAEREADFGATPRRDDARSAGEVVWYSASAPRCRWTGLALAAVCSDS